MGDGDDVSAAAVDASHEEREKRRALFRLAPDAHDDERCEDAATAGLSGAEGPCKDCIVEASDAASEDAIEARARDRFESGQPLGEWDR
jgi:hypothetical protein